MIYHYMAHTTNLGFLPNVTLNESDIDGILDALTYRVADGGQCARADNLLAEITTLAMVVSKMKGSDE